MLPWLCELIWRSTGRRFLRRFASLSRSRQVEREKLFRRLKVDFINIRTGEEYTQALLKYFRLRARRH